MTSDTWLDFGARIEKVGINPCVTVPAAISSKFKQRGYIPVKLDLNGSRHLANLVPLGNEVFRLYLNGPMLKATGWNVGDTVPIRLRSDPVPRVEPIPTALTIALRDNPAAQMALDAAAPSRRKEIFRYINNLKTAEAVERNIRRIIGALSGTDTHPTVR